MTGWQFSFRVASICLIISRKYRLKIVMLFFYLNNFRLIDQKNISQLPARSPNPKPPKSIIYRILRVGIPHQK